MLTFTPAVNAYRLYADGTESGSSPLELQDTPHTTPSLSADYQFHVRVRIQETGGASGLTTDDYSLEYELNDSGTWIPITTTSSRIRVDTASSLTDSDATTNRATNGIADGTGSFIAGVQEEGDGSILNWQLTASNYSELVWALRVIAADCSTGDQFDFRVVLNAGAPGITTSPQPRLTVTKPAAPDLSWTPKLPTRIFAKQAVLAAAMATTFVAPIVVPDVTHPVTPLSWAPRYPDRVAPGPRVPAGMQQYGGWNPHTPADVVLLLDWLPIAPSQHLRPRWPVLGALSGAEPPWATVPTTLPPGPFDVVLRDPSTFAHVNLGGAPALTFWAPSFPSRPPRVRLAVDRGGVVAPLVVPDVTDPAPSLSWAPTYPDRTAAGPRFPAGAQLVEAWHADTPVVVVALDQWAPSYPDRVPRRPLPTPAGAVAPLHVPDITDPVPDRSWQPTYPDRIPRQPQTPPSGQTPLPRVDAAVALVGVSDVSSTVPRGLLVRQYQALTGPVLVPAVAPAVPDQWAPQYPDRVPRLAVPTPAGAVAPLHVPDVTSPAPALSWQPRYPDQHLTPRRAQVAPQVVAPAYVPDVTAPAPDLSWQPTYPDQHLVPRRAQVAPQAVAPVYVPDVTTAAPALSWAPTYPDRYRVPLRAQVAPQAVAPLVVPDVTQPAPVRSWAPTYPNQARGPQRAQVAPQAVAPLIVPDVTDPAPDRSWAPTYPDRVAPGPRVAAGVQLVEAWHPDTPVVLVVPDQWPPVYPDVVRRPVAAPPSGAVGPLVVPDVTVPVPDQWQPRYPDRIARRPQTPPSGQVPLPRVDAAAPVVVGSGESAGTVPRGPIVRQYQALTSPVVAILETPPVVPDLPLAVWPQPTRRPYARAVYAWAQPMFGVVVEVPVQSWIGHYPDLIPRRVLRPAGALVAPVEPPAPPTPAPDLAAPVYPDRVPARPRAQVAPQAVAPVYVPDVTDPAPARSWAPTYLDRHLIPRRAQIAPQAVAPVVVPDVTAPAPARSWAPVYPDRVPAALRAQVAPQAVAPLYVADVTVVAPARSWAPVYPDRPARRLFSAAAQQAVARDRFDAPGVVEVPILSWAPRYPDRVPPRPPVLLTPHAVAPIVVPDVTDPAPLRSWAPTYPDRYLVPRRAQVAPQAVAPLYVADVTVVAPALSWQPRYPDRPARRLFATAAQQAVARDRLEPPGTVDLPLRSWAPHYPDRVPGRRPVLLTPHVVAPVLVPDVTQPVPARSWAPLYPDRVPAARRAQVAPQAVAPLYVADVTVVAPALSWTPIYPDRPDRKLFSTAAQQTTARDRFDAPGTIEVSDFLWAPQYPTNIRILTGPPPQVAPQAVAPVFVPDVTDPAPVLSWAPVLLDAYRMRRFSTALQATIAQDRFDAPALGPLFLIHGYLTRTAQTRGFTGVSEQVPDKGGNVVAVPELGGTVEDISDE